MEYRIVVISSVWCLQMQHPWFEWTHVGLTNGWPLIILLLLSMYVLYVCKCKSKCTSKCKCKCKCKLCIVLYVTLYVCTYVRTYVKIGNYLSGWLVEPSTSKVPKLAQAIPAAELPLHSLQKKHFSFQSCNGWWWIYSGRGLYFGRVVWPMTKNRRWRLDMWYDSTNQHRSSLQIGRSTHKITALSWRMLESWHQPRPSHL